MSLLLDFFEQQEKGAAPCSYTTTHLVVLVQKRACKQNKWIVMKMINWLTSDPESVIICRHFLACLLRSSHSEFSFILSFLSVQLPHFPPHTTLSNSPCLFLISSLKNVNELLSNHINYPPGLLSAPLRCFQNTCYGPVVMKADTRW